MSEGPGQSDNSVTYAWINTKEKERECRMPELVNSRMLREKEKQRVHATIRENNVP